MAYQPGTRTSLVGNVQPLPVIAEDEAVEAPAIPPKSPRRLSHTRSGHRMSSLSSPGLYEGRNQEQEQKRKQQQQEPEEEEEYCPPPPSFAYAGKRRMRSAIAEHKAELGGGEMMMEPGGRLPHWLAGRGGWYRVCFAVLALALTIVAVAVGVAFGVRPWQRNITAGREQIPGRSDQSPVGMVLFPAGSYSFTAALTSVASNCTSEPAAFGCYPFGSTYNRSSPPEASAATFQWVIRPLGDLRYSISSSANPFAPRFANISTTLVDAGLGSERFAFNFTYSKVFVPTKRLTGGAAAAPPATTCWYNRTVVEVTVWTRERPSYPTPAPVVVANGPQPVPEATWDFNPWPFRFSMAQRQAPGPQTPDCRDFDGRPIGSGLSAAPETAGECACLYRNFDLG
ncbi:hypothetical protein MAPG_07135 [Magnaporthiopsis poae ATCC 64411]|uniref:Tat pathway signal sequence n=1 Tax=Magnaporthiopsis poae (strain ATCC 64411 / 73-15) TaxID=644358 RepID=A0A0C4E3W0_MAGP6|nr:hypothetical protein MAPG_07135 [Magnaporthiopsis poae ATCC 64411]